MRSIRIIHAADLHLDSPFQALSAAKASVRREEQGELLAALSLLEIKGLIQALPGGLYCRA
jgi:hypothetical protein